MSDLSTGKLRIGNFGTGDLAAALLRLALWPTRLIAARATLAMLAALDARELADIGLSRSDLRDATALRRDLNPTDFLAGRAAERRASAERVGAPSRLCRRAPPLPAATGS